MQVARHHAARYFQLNNRGAIAPGCLADLAVVEDLRSFQVAEVFKKGRPVDRDGQVADFPEPVIPTLWLTTRGVFTVGSQRYI